MPVPVEQTPGPELPPKLTDLMDCLAIGSGSPRLGLRLAEFARFVTNSFPAGASLGLTFVLPRGAVIARPRFPV